MRQQEPQGAGRGSAGGGHGGTDARWGRALACSEEGDAWAHGGRICQRRWGPTSPTPQDLAGKAVFLVHARSAAVLGMH